jgi:hypothetical protein
MASAMSTGEQRNYIRDARYLANLRTHFHDGQHGVVWAGGTGLDGGSDKRECERGLERHDEPRIEVGGR